jgi:hypothetical protein
MAIHFMHVEYLQITPYLYICNGSKKASNALHSQSVSESGQDNASEKKIWSIFDQNEKLGGFNKKRE